MPTYTYTHLPLLFLLFSLHPTLISAAGTITLSSPSECIVLAQIDPSSNTYTAGRPICPGAGASAIQWPLSGSGAGQASSMAIYANFNGGAPGCAMGISPAQAGYLEGRTLEWKGAEDQMWDATSAGLLLNTDTWAPMGW